MQGNGRFRGKFRPGTQGKLDVELKVKQFKDLLIGDLTHLGVLVAVGMEGETTEPVYRFTSCRVRLVPENEFERVVVYGHLTQGQVDMVVAIQLGQEFEFPHDAREEAEETVKLAYVTFKVPLVAQDGQPPATDHADAVRKAFDLLVRRPVGARIETTVEVLQDESDREDKRLLTIGNDALDDYLRTGR